MNVLVLCLIITILQQQFYKYSNMAYDLVKSGRSRVPEKATKILVYFAIDSSTSIISPKYIQGEEEVKENTWRKICIPGSKKKIDTLLIKISGKSFFICHAQ